MKKMNVNIATPCHENWDAMSESEKGKFCASCQKIVVDFTSMSDRQIIEYFSKSTGSVCGRLTNEQLSKDLVIPPKPIPWVKYFFKFTFPAFVMTLKSCIPNTESKHAISKSYNLTRSKSNTNLLNTVKGDTTFGTTNIEEKRCTMGVIMPPKDVIAKQKPSQKIAIKNKSSFKSKMKIQPIPLIDSQIIHPATINLQTKWNDDVILSHTLGGISMFSVRIYSRPINMIKKAIDTINIFSSTPKIQLFPNPVSSNSQLNIKLNNINQGDYLLSVITTSGVIVQNEEIRVDVKNSVIHTNLKTLLAGTYIVRIVDKSNGKSLAQKLIVL